MLTASWYKNVVLLCLLGLSVGLISKGKHVGVFKKNYYIFEFIRKQISIITKFWRGVSFFIGIENVFIIILTQNGFYEIKMRLGPF